MADGHPIWRQPRVLFPAALTIIVAVAIYLRMPGWNPSSLYLDDQWVALLVRDVSMGRILELRPPSPPGFLALLKAITGAQPEPWRWQLLNLLLIAAQIPLFAVAVYRITSSRSVGMLAAALVAVNPTLALHSLRAKHYALESLVIIVMVYLAIETLRRRQFAWLIALAVVGVVGVLFSFPSLLVAGVLLNVTGAGLYLAVRPEAHVAASEASAPAGVSPGKIALVVLAGNLALLLLYLGLVRTYAHAGIIGAWTTHYLPLGSVGDAWEFLVRTGLRAWRGALPREFAGAGGLPWVGLLLVLVPVGLFWLMRSTTFRPLGVAIAALMLAMLALSATHRYPLGGGRTDIYTYPLTLTALACGLVPLVRRYRQLGPLVAILALAIAVGNVRPRYGYPETGDRAMVELMSSRIRDTDTLVVYPWANWALGLYGPWPGHPIPSHSSNGYTFEPDRPHTLALVGEVAGRPSFIDDPAILVEQLDPLLAAAPPRIAYYAIEADTDASVWIPRYIAQHGYEQVEARQDRGALFVLLERRVGP